MKIAFNPSTVAALTAPPNNKDITFDLRGQNIFARGVKFYGTDTNTWRDIKVNNVSIGSHTLDLRNGSNTTLTNTNGVVTINSTWRPVVDNLTSNSATSSLSANQGRVLAGLINGKSDSNHNHDGRYVKRSGDTMLGALNFANGTWNLVGDDSYIGDCNLSGHFGIRAANTVYPGIAFFNNSKARLGNLTAYSGNIRYGAYSLQFLDNGNTSVNASTWMNPFTTYDKDAVEDGQAICVWGQGSSLSNLSSDGGNIALYLRRINASAATLNMVLDGEYYANGNQRLAHVSEIPTKNSWNYDDRYYTKAESNAKYITDITTSVNKLTFTRNGANIAKDITVNVVYHQGNLTNISDKNATTKASSGLFIYNSYGQLLGTNSYSSVLSINTGGTIQIAGNWGDDQSRNLYWRSQSDRSVSSYPWKSWRTILDSENYSSTLDSRYYTESEVNSLLDAKLNRQNLSYGTWNPRGYNLAADYNYNGGDLSISENGGQIHVSIDGYFWQNGGKYRVLDTSDVAGLKGNLTVYQYLSATDGTWWPLIWGGNSHSNTNDSTGAVYKSHDKLSWQTSTQTLYATNIRTKNIDSLSIGGGIYWDPHVESASNGSDAASITLVKSGVAGGTTLVLSQMNDANDTIQFKTNSAARLYHNSYPILTIQNTYVSNGKGYINGTEITQVNNSDTIDGWHKDNIQWTGYITSPNSIASYWFKMYDITVTEHHYNDITITFLVSEGFSSHFSIFYLRIRQNGTDNSGNYHLGISLYELVGNLRDKVVAYYNNSTGNVQLWGDTRGQWNTMNYTILKKTYRTRTDSASLGTLTAQSFSSVQTPPSTGYYKVTMSRVGSVSYSDSTGSVHWNNVTNKPSSFTPSSHTHTWTSITDKIVAGNEFNIVNAGFKDNLWLNFLPINDRSKSATIDFYHLGNGHKGYASLIASGFLKNGSSDSYVLLGGGGHKLESALNVANATNAYHLRINSANTWSTWYWAGQGGQPNWLWGSNDGTNMYVWNPSNFRVAYAASAGNAETLGGMPKNQGLAPFGSIPCIRNDGVMEIGRYIDYHYDSSGKYDFSTRLQVTGNYRNEVNLPSTSGTLALINDVNNYYWANVKISTSSSTTTSPTVSNLTATNSIRMNKISLDNTNEINNITNDGDLHLNCRNSGNVSLCAGGGKVGIGTRYPSHELCVMGYTHTKGFGINPYYLSDSVLLPTINLGDGYTYRCLEIGRLTKISCIIADRTYVPGSARGVLLNFKEGFDGQIILLKDLQNYGQGNGYFWVMPSGCNIIRADGSSILVGQYQISNIYDDGMSRFLIYSSKYRVWIEFLCANIN